MDNDNSRQPQNRAIITLVCVEVRIIFAYNVKAWAIIVFTKEDDIMSMRKIYRKIAKEHGVSPKEVREEIQAAITQAYENPPDDNITVAYQNRVPRRGKIPTPEEFIRYAANQLKQESK